MGSLLLIVNVHNIIWSISFSFPFHGPPPGPLLYRFPGVPYFRETLHLCFPLLSSVSTYGTDPWDWDEHRRMLRRMFALDSRTLVTRSDIHLCLGLGRITVRETMNVLDERFLPAGWLVSIQILSPHHVALKTITQWQQTINFSKLQVFFVYKL